MLQEFSPTVHLGQFAFANASKKNRVNLAAGTAVYGRISGADFNIEQEIECFDSSTGQEGGFGELKGGTVIDVSLPYARALLFEGGLVLDAIGKIAPFEIAIGMNGKIWVKGEDNISTWKMSRCIKESEHWAPESVSDQVKKIFSS